MSMLPKFDRGNRFSFIIGAIFGVVAIKTQPDGNLLVTTVCAVIGGSFSLILWILIKKLRQKLGKKV